MDKLRGLVPVIVCLLVLGGCKKTESWIGSTVKIATEEATDITHNSVVLHGRLLSKGLVIEGDGPHRRYSFEVCDNDRFEDSAEYFYLDATSEDGETFSVDVGAYLAGYENKGLAMGAEYYYRARALLNGVKYQAFGEVRKFRTEVLPVEVSAGATDLGLGVNWGGCNLGAASPEDAGEYYAWAEVEPKGNYGTDTYRWKLFGKDADDPYSNKEGWSLSPSEDAARVLLGNQWHTPTKAEWKELMDNCEWIRAQRNGVYGFLVRSKKEVLEDRCIFLPAAGKKQHDTVEGMNSWGGYLSSTHGINSNCSIFIIYQALLSPLQDTGPVELGYSVRPVQIKAE